MKFIDISAGEEESAKRLSNFTAHKLTFRGIECASPEGLLQSLKFEDTSEQLHVCTLVGVEAKRAGRKRNKAWQSVQTLWWQGESFPRSSLEFQLLLNEIFEALAKNTTFCQTLLSTGDATLIHTIGEKDPTKTVLTEEEFCSRLTAIRARLRQ